MRRVLVARCCLRTSSATTAASNTLTTLPFSTLTHVSSDGRRAAMVDVGGKAVTRRDATARCVVRFPAATLAALGVLDASTPSFSSSATTTAGCGEGSGASAAESWQQRDLGNLSSKKGPILTTAVVAGVMAAKKTSDLLPFCHPLPLDGVHVDLAWCAHDALEVTCRASTTHSTGVEMEALTGASAAALCVYDMCKASSHDIRITDLELVAKSGGKRDFNR